MRLLTQQENQSLTQLQSLPESVQVEILHSVLNGEADLVSAVAARSPAHSAAELGQGGIQ